jgi:hypothetical protein
MMGRSGQGFQPRGMGRPGPAMPPPPDVRPFPQRSPEDVIRPVPPMQRRGMGGWGQGRGMMNRYGQGFSPRGMGRPGPRFPEPKPEND